MKKAQLNELYITRALAILGVLIVHATSYTFAELSNTSTLYGVYSFGNTFFRIGTTTFIFLSSFVLFYSYYHRPTTASLIGNFYKKRFLYIILPYVLFTIVYFYINSYHIFAPILTTSEIVSEFLYQLSQGKAAAHLYFVFISIQFYILFPILLLVFKRYPKLVKHTFWIGFALQWIFVILNKYYFQLDKGNLAISYFSFYFMGIFFGVYFDRIKAFLTVKRNQLFTTKIGWLTISLWLSWIVISSINVTINYFSRTVYGFYLNSLIFELVWNLHTILSAIVLLQASFVIYRVFRPKVVNTLMHLGVVSFGVYLIHLLILNYAHQFIPTYGKPILYHLSIVAGFLLSLFVSWLVVHLVMKHFKWSWIIFGAGPKKMPIKSEATEPSIDLPSSEETKTKELVYK
ncbi:acyltransferase [Ureibacillus acetophenoni]|uniref:Peptidoglycan/LPS O-acetylase OafA/YrhL n=1 Tax=Ureibacillus acetophenoni TaxID=614649 RepID=A0A285TYX6_9BACL|nr:acyltransferase [Ureibacillus acetophenoni]SOC34884.1 peptidoglycan/LPS O-acetylase OafA/YrhL [Ureibacillus acetophenoni]